MSEREALLALLRRWRGGLVPVGDYSLRAETDAALGVPPPHGECPVHGPPCDHSGDWCSGQCCVQAEQARE